MYKEKYGWFDAPITAPTKMIVESPQEAVEFINGVFGKPPEFYYSATELKEMFGAMFVNGIVAKYSPNSIENGVAEALGDSFKATPVPAKLEISLNPGYAWVNGAYYILKDDKKPIALEAGKTNHIVLRIDLSEGDVKVRSMATDTMIRNDEIYDILFEKIPLSANAVEVKESDIIDCRLSSDLGSDGKVVCGVTTPLLSNEWGQRLAQQASKNATDARVAANEASNSKRIAENAATIAETARINVQDLVANGDKLTSAFIAPYSITRGKIEYGAVVPEKTSFIGKANVYQGCQLGTIGSSNGQFSPPPSGSHHQVYVATDIFTVTEGQRYITNFNIHGAYAYNAARTFIGIVGYEEAWMEVHDDQEIYFQAFTAPPGAFFMRIQSSEGSRMTVI